VIGGKDMDLHKAADNLAPTNASESALLLTAAPGAYTGIASGFDGTTGIGLVEVYNPHQAATERQKESDLHRMPNE
jgi:hypothetical protein